MKTRVLHDYSFMNMIIALHKYRTDKRENYNSDPAGSKILGLGLTIFILLFVLSLAIWIWALYLIIKYAKTMPTWAVVISVICLFLFTGGPVVTIILCYATKGMKHSKIQDGPYYSPMASGGQYGSSIYYD